MLSFSMFDCSQPRRASITAISQPAAIEPRHRDSDAASCNERPAIERADYAAICAEIDYHTAEQ